jgi:hypothetical protein
MFDSQESQEEHTASRSSELVHKITKYRHEPFLYNDRLYKFEDNPEEYRKARKRLQNKESAIKVRTLKRKEDQLQALEVAQLQAENKRLCLQNASL